MEEIQEIVDEISAAEQAREQGQQDETLPTGKITQFTIRQVEHTPRYSHEPYDEILTADAESVSYRFHSDIEEKYHPTDWSYRTVRYDYRSDYDSAQRKLRLLLKHYPEKEFIKTDDAPDLYIDAAFEDGTVVSRHFRLPTHRTYKVFIDFYKPLERLVPFRELPPRFTKNIWR